MRDTDSVDGIVRGSSRLAAAVAVAAVVVAVVATLSVPHLFSSDGTGGPSVPRPTEPARRLELPGTRTWQPVQCPPRSQDTCVAPVLLDHAGVMFSRVETRRLEVAPDDAGHALKMTVARSGNDRWVLVGAERAAADSVLTITLGSAPSATVPAGRLSLFPLPGSGRLEVTVTDRGHPRQTEVLRIAQYESR